MELSDALRFARSKRQGVLTTIKVDGRPQLSNLTYCLNEAHEVRISVTADRAKYFNLLRDPRASVHVTSEDFYAYAVLEGTATVMPVAASPDDPTVEALVELYRLIAGEHPDWNDYRAAMIADRRTVVSIPVDHAYGMLRPT